MGAAILGEHYVAAFAAPTTVSPPQPSSTVSAAASTSHSSAAVSAMAILAVMQSSSMVTTSAAINMAEIEARLKQAEEDAKNASHDAKVAKAAVKNLANPNVNVDAEELQVEEPVSATDPSTQARIARLEAQLNEVTSAVAQLTLTDQRHDEGNPHARFMLFADRIVSQPKHSASAVDEKAIAAANVFYAGLESRLGKQLAEYQKKSSIAPQRLDSIKNIQADQQAMAEQKIVGTERLRSFLGCLCCERQETQSAHQASVANTMRPLQLARKTTSELAGIYDQYITEIFQQLQLKFADETERAVAITELAQQYRQQHVQVAASAIARHL